mmetsp:Transcript_116133/g.339595  ORF Transcript_116133/g.339595 Transcript_116133/m.339595 type:complete len:544 (-) Transcript_116133:193-1824(-)
MSADLAAEEGAHVRRLLAPNRLRVVLPGLQRMPSWCGLEDLLDPREHLLLLEIADHIQCRIPGVVPLLMEVPQVLLLPALDLLLLADGELGAQLVGLVEPRERPSFNAVLHVIDLLHLSQHRLPLLLDALVQHLGREGDLVQRLQGRHVHAGAVLLLHGRVDVVDGVLEVRQRVRPRAGADEALALATSQEADVLHHVRDALLVRLLVDAADVQLDVRLEALGRHGVLQEHVAEAVGEDAAAHPLVQRQRLVLLQALWLLWPLDEAAPRCVPMRLPVEETQLLYLCRQLHAHAGRGLGRGRRALLLCRWGRCTCSFCGGGGSRRGRLLDHLLALLKQLHGGVGHPSSSIPDAKRILDLCRVRGRRCHKAPAVRPAVEVRREGPLLRLVVEEVDRLAVRRQAHLLVDVAAVHAFGLLLVLAAEGLAHGAPGAHDDAAPRGLVPSLFLLAIRAFPPAEQVLDALEEAALCRGMCRAAALLSLSLRAARQQRPEHSAGRSRAGRRACRALSRAGREALRSPPCYGGFALAKVCLPLHGHCGERLAV